MTNAMGNFDATHIPPVQGGGKHPAGHFPFTITNTLAKPTKDGKGGIFVVEFSSPAGKIVNNYNLWNESAQAVEIAQKELSALCHATGIFKLTMDQNNLANAGFELRGASGTMEVAPQAANPEYNEVKRVFDRNGNEPGKPPGQVQQPQNQGASTQQQQPAGWGTQSAPPNPNPGWTQGPTQQQPSSPPTGWGSPNTPTATAPAAPPWASGGR